MGIDVDNNNNDSIQNTNKGIQAELDVMIAEENYRKRGMGKEASLLMMLYGAQSIDIRRFFVRIKEDNIASRTMFENLGFRECNYEKCFGEYELEYTRSSSQEMVRSIRDIYKMRMYEWKINE